MLHEYLVFMLLIELPAAGNGGAQTAAVPPEYVCEASSANPDCAKYAKQEKCEKKKCLWVNCANVSLQDRQDEAHVVSLKACGSIPKEAPRRDEPSAAPGEPPAVNKPPRPSHVESRPPRPAGAVRANPPAPATPVGPAPTRAAPQPTEETTTSIAETLDTGCAKGSVLRNGWEINRRGENISGYVKFYGTDDQRDRSADNPPCTKEVAIPTASPTVAVQTHVQTSNPTAEPSTRGPTERPSVRAADSDDSIQGVGAADVGSGSDARTVATTGDSNSREVSKEDSDDLVSLTDVERTSAFDYDSDEVDDESEVGSASDYDKAGEVADTEDAQAQKMGGSAAEEDTAALDKLSTPEVNATPAPQAGGSDGTGAIIAAVIIVLFAVMIGAVVCYRRKKKDKNYQSVAIEATSNGWTPL